VRLRWNQRWNQKQTARAHSRRSRSYAVPEDIPLLAPGTAALPPAGSRSSGCRCPLSMCHRQTCRSPGRMSRRPNRARSRSRREPDSFSASVAYRVGHLDAIYEFQDLLLSESRRPAREPGPLHNARNLCHARACPEGDCSSQGHYLPRPNHSTRDDRSDEQELARDKLCFVLPFLASLIYPGHGQLIPLLIRLLLGVESPVDRRG
jgi:hypothetical protein